LEGVNRNHAFGIAFVTNQVVTEPQRTELHTLAAPITVELFHLERVVAILDSPDMARVREQFLDIKAENPASIQLGGEGGRAPGAGGGGGGAMGQFSTGGDGGAGGNILLAGQPGAGGGGAGTTGDGAVGGDGGGGGEYFEVTLGPNEIGPDSGFHHFEIRVGTGGTGSTGDGSPGEDTIVNACDAAGNVLHSFVARGGDGGAAGKVPLQKFRRRPTTEDVRAGLKVTGMLAAELLRVKNGLWTVIDGGWEFYQTDAFPFRFQLAVLIEIDTGTIEPGTMLELNIVVRSPDGFSTQTQVVAITTPDSLVRRIRFPSLLEISGSVFGLWRVCVLADSILIGELPLEITNSTRQIQVASA
jgi:hypothetical protein